MRYFAVRPTSTPDKNIRIEKAPTPSEAARLAFGRGPYGPNWSWKDLGTRVAVIHSDKKRVALLLDPHGWYKFPNPKKGD